MPGKRGMMNDWEKVQHKWVTGAWVDSRAASTTGGWRGLEMETLDFESFDFVGEVLTIGI